VGEARLGFLLPLFISRLCIMSSHQKRYWY